MRRSCMLSRYFLPVIDSVVVNVAHPPFLTLHFLTNRVLRHSYNIHNISHYIYIYFWHLGVRTRRRKATDELRHASLPAEVNNTLYPFICLNSVDYYYSFTALYSSRMLVISLFHMLRVCVIVQA